MQPAGSSAGRPERGDQLDRPRFRQDLVAELIDEQGARFIDVMDPDSGNLFRFYEVEYSLACAMDGERDVPGIVKWAQEELGLTPSQQEVRNVIATLGDLGFIDSGAHEAPGEAAAPDLAAGVVVGNQMRVPAASQVDLGTAGGAAPQRVRPVTPAPDFALGAPGAAARRAHEPVEDVALGAPGRRPGRPTPSGSQPPASAAAAAGGAGDVSLDLADHIAVGRAEVQEAVRASKVMSAVDVPQSVLDAIEDRPTARAASPTVDRPPEILRVPEPRPEVRARDARDPRDLRDPRDVRPEVKPGEVRVGKSPLTRAPSGPLKPVVELPKPPVVAEKPVPAAAPARSGVSPILLVVLVLAVLGGAAYLIWRYLSGPSDGAGSSAETATPTTRPLAPPPAPPPPPPPPPVTAKIALETPPADDVKSTRAGVIETIMADKSTVKAGDVIVKFVGDKPIEAELSNIGRDVKRLQDAIDATTARRDAAQTAGNKAAEAKELAQLETQKKGLAAKHDLQATRMTDLDKFLIHAPSAGTFTPTVKLGKKVAANDVLASIQRDPTPVATFNVTDVKPYAVNTSVELGVGSGEQRVVCTIAAIQEGSVKVACPAESLNEGADVTLKTSRSKPEAAQPTDAPTPPAPPATVGSGASTAPGGEAPAAAGGAAPAAGGTEPAAAPPTEAPAAPAPSPGSAGSAGP